MLWSRPDILRMLATVPNISAAGEFQFLSPSIFQKQFILVILYRSILNTTLVTDRTTKRNGTVRRIEVHIMLSECSNGNRSTALHLGISCAVAYHIIFR